MNEALNPHLISAGAIVIGGLHAKAVPTLPPAPGGDDIPDSLIDTSISVMVDAHRNQKRFGGEPYRVHPEAVAAALPRAIKPLGYTHDVMEDNPEEYPLARMQTLFPAWMTTRLVVLTKLPGEPYDEYMLRILASRDFFVWESKRQDLKHNLLTLGKGALRDKYRLALRMLGETP